MTERPKDFDMAWFDENLRPLLPQYSRDFASIEYGRGIDTYIKRLERIGLDRVGAVLDAGGGIANWSIPLALLNQQTEVVDISSERLLVGRMMADRMQIKNINFRYASIDALPHADATFNAVLCYSVIMFTDIKKTLGEFRRVLKPGGRLYIMTDLWRWYAGQGVPATGKVRHFAGLAYSRLRRSVPKFLTARQVNLLVEGAGFRIVDFGQDGQSTFLGVDEYGANAFYPLKPAGAEQLWEVCAVKDNAG